MPEIELRSELMCALAKIIKNGKYTHAEIAKSAGMSSGLKHKQFATASPADWTLRCRGGKEPIEAARSFPDKWLSRLGGQ
jgi:hypothetical protein